MVFELANLALNEINACKCCLALSQGKHANFSKNKMKHNVLLYICVVSYDTLK